MFLKKIGTCKTAWYKTTDRHLLEYKKVLSIQLAGVCLPRDLLMCHDAKCCNVNRVAHLRSYANDIIQACIKTAKEVIPSTGTAKNNGSHSNHIPGWKDYVTPAREASLFWHNLWNDCGRPRSGVVSDCMRRTRLAYHYAIRHVRKQEVNLVKEQFAKIIMENRTRDFWSEINRMKNSTAGLCDIPLLAA